MVVPVINELSSEARNHAAFAMSLGFVILFMGSISSNLRRRSSESAPVPMLFSSLRVPISALQDTSPLNFTHMLVSPTAGKMQLNRIVGAYSNAIVLDAVYTGTETTVSNQFYFGGLRDLRSQRISRHCKWQSRGEVVKIQCWITKLAEPSPLSRGIWHRPGQVDEGTVSLLLHVWAYHLCAQKYRLS